MTYNVQCPRCGGTGRYDRGTCFECKGMRVVHRKTKPRGKPLVFIVKYNDGTTTNEIKMYYGHTAKDIELAEEAIIQSIKLSKTPKPGGRVYRVRQE